MAFKGCGRFPSITYHHYIKMGDLCDSNKCMVVVCRDNDGTRGMLCYCLDAPILGLPVYIVARPSVDVIRGNLTIPVGYFVFLGVAYNYIKAIMSQEKRGADHS